MSKSRNRNARIKAIVAASKTLDAEFEDLIRGLIDPQLTLAQSRELLAHLISEMPPHAMEASFEALNKSLKRALFKKLGLPMQLPAISSKKEAQEVLSEATFLSDRARLYAAAGRTVEANRLRAKAARKKAEGERLRAEESKKYSS